MPARLRRSMLSRRVPAVAGSSSEPSYNAATDKLIFTDGFDTYASIQDTAPTFVSRYPDYRGIDLIGNVTNQGSPVVVFLRDFISLQSPGRNGAGQYLRLTYGNPTPPSPQITVRSGVNVAVDGAQDIIVGTSGRLGSIGSWDGTLPEKAGPYTHFLMTTWIRFTAGVDPTQFHASGIKGLMHWHTNNQRYEHAVHTVGNECGGFWYNEARWDVAVHPRNSDTGFNIWKTADGGAPKFAPYSDGNWHRSTVEYYSGGDPSGHFGARWWLDGVKVLDDVDINWSWASWCQPDWTQYAIIYHMVFGNFITQSQAQNTPTLHVDFDDWIAWTN